MRNALVFGGSGQIGEPVIARLLAEGWQVQAVSRQPRGDRAGLRWLRGGFDGFEEPLPVQVDTVFSLGPLDRFSLWYEHSSLMAARVIAFGSTSIDTKHASADAGERALATRLQDGETRVFRTAQARGAQATLLRPTLVYGAGRDQTLSRIAALARRTGFFVLPAGACGRRQPVHVEDLAAAALAVIDCAACAGNSYALPGGETLGYRDMIARTLLALDPPARLLEAPAFLFRTALWLARRTGRMGGLSDAAVARMRDDLVFDAAPAMHDFGYAPRPFQPDARALGL